MDYIDNKAMEELKDNLIKLSKYQFKLFYGMIVYYWAEYGFFISKQNFKNLRSELNFLCAEVDERFPNPFDDYELVKFFCHMHPYYFIDILYTETIIGCFCQYLNDRVDVLAMVANKLSSEGLRAAYEYSNKALGLSENIEKLVKESEVHLSVFS